MSLMDIIKSDLDGILQDWDDVIWNNAIYKGIFHNEYESVDIFEGQVESRNPFVEVKESEFSEATHGDILTINSIDYQIKEIQPDGMGLIKLMLSIKDEDY